MFVCSYVSESGLAVDAPPECEAPLDLDALGLSGGGPACEAPLNLDALGISGEPSCEPLDLAFLDEEDAAEVGFGGPACEAPLDLDHLLVEHVARPLRQPVRDGVVYQSSAYYSDIARMRWQADEAKRARDEAGRHCQVRHAWDTAVAWIGDSTCWKLRGHHNTNTWEFICQD